MEYGRYAKIMKNDAVDGNGLCVSLWVQGCPFQCKGCHNEELWNFDGGQPFTEDTVEEILQAINSHNVRRNFSVLGGEPLTPTNEVMVEKAVKAVRERYPNIEIIIWTGFTYAQLQKRINNDMVLKNILNNCNYLIDGQFELDKRNITLKWRGSPNQNIWKKENGKWRCLTNG